MVEKVYSLENGRAAALQRDPPGFIRSTLHGELLAVVARRGNVCRDGFHSRVG